MKIRPIVALTMFAIVPLAHAQDDESEGARSGVPAQPNSSRQLEEILVTATKVETSLRDVPISMEALSGEDLVRQGMTSLDDILKNSPSVNKTSGQVTIRGVGITNDKTLGSGEETGYFLGEATLIAPSAASALPDFDPYDLSTVEILMGPQSTLFGGTALAGAIRYIPNKPDFDGFYGSVRGGYGWLSHADDPQKQVSAMLNLPVTDHFALRAAGTLRDTPNVTDDLVGNRDNLDSSELTQARIMARWEIGERFSADLTYMRYDASRYLTFLDSPRRYESRYTRLNEATDDKVEVGSLSLSYAFDKFALTAVVNTLDSRLYSPVDGAPVLGVSDIGIIPSRVRGNSKVPSYELRAVSSEPTESGWWLFDNWEYVAGLYYMEARQRVQNNTTFQASILQLLGFPIPVPGDVEVAFSGARNVVDVSEKAIYFNLNRRVWDEQLELNVGARFAESSMDALGAPSSLGVEQQQFRSRDDDRRINPKLALTWHFTEDLNIRASVSEGFRFGGANTAATIGIEDIPPTFSSDSLRNYELGLRSDWLDRTLRLDVTGFHMDWKDMQIYQNSPLAQAYTDNVGSATIDGVEASFTWSLPSDLPLVPEGLTLRSGVSYLDARISERFNSANGTVEADTRLPLSPRESATLGLAWQGQWGSWDVNATVLASYAGSRTNNLINTYEFDPYTTWNASLRMANASWPGAPAITLSGVNLTDEFILAYANPTTLNPNQFVFIAQGPRAIKLDLEFSFGKN